MAFLEKAEKIKDATTKAAKAAAKIKTICKFLSTVVGQIVMWVIIILLAIILMYILANTIANGIAEVFGIETPGLTESADYQILKELQNSGYNTLMDSGELKNYLIYEYGVLMDAARFFHDTGVYQMNVDDKSPVQDLEYATDAEIAFIRATALGGNLGNNTEEQQDDENTSENSTSSTDDALAYFNAATTSRKAQAEAEKKKWEKEKYEALKKLAELYEGYNKYYKLSSRVDQYANTKELEASKVDLQKAYEKGYLTEAEYQTTLKSIDFMCKNYDNDNRKLNIKIVFPSVERTSLDELSNADSSKELFYKVVETDDGASIMPYLRIFREAVRYEHYFMNNPVGGEKNNLVKIDPTTGKYTTSGEDILTDINNAGTAYTEAVSTAYETYKKSMSEMSENMTSTAKIETEKGLRANLDKAIKDAYATYTQTVNFQGYYVNSDLNAKNGMLYKAKSSRPNTNPKLTVIQDYPKDQLFYTKSDAGSATYEIPFKVLADRFLPKATLLSSWYMLKDSAKNEEKAGEIDELLDSIQDVYNAACLRFEETDEDITDTIFNQYVASMTKDEKDTLLEKGLNKENYTNYQTFLVFDRIFIEMNTLGNWEIVDPNNYKFTACTDLVQAVVLNLNFDDGSIKLNVGAKNTEESETLSTLEGEDKKVAVNAKSSLKSFLQKKIDAILNGEDTITISGVECKLYSYSGKYCEADARDVWSSGEKASDSSNNDGKSKDNADSNNSAENNTDNSNSSSNNANGEGETAQTVTVYNAQEHGNGYFKHENDDRLTQTGEGENPNAWYYIRTVGEDSKKILIDTVALKDAIQAKLKKYVSNWNTQKNEDEKLNNTGIKFTANITLEDSVIGSKPKDLFLYEDIAFAIIQQSTSKKMPAYFPKRANTWSRDIEYTNEVTIGGKFNPDSMSSLIPAGNQYAGGYQKMTITDNSWWRLDLFGNILRTTEDDEGKTGTVRENDVIMMLSEWEQLADEGEFAADTYVRDLYKMIEYLKKTEVSDSSQNDDEEKETEEAEDTDDEEKPTIKKNYLLPTSYEYINVPDEILYYDETTTDFSFWMEHLLASEADPIKPIENTTMRSRMEIMKWQEVEYELYPECWDKSSRRRRWRL